VARVIVTERNSVQVVEVIARGPQGPPGPPTTGSGLFVNDAAKIDKSIVYYDAPSSSYKADAIWTTSTIVDGANF
jgi:hypothetical protein